MLAFKNILGLGALLFLISCSSVSTNFEKNGSEENTAEKVESKEEKERIHRQMQFTRSYYDRF